MSIVIPVRDSAGLPPMLRNLPAADEMIVVTAEPAEDAAVLATCPDALLVQQSRSGVGNALACGFAAATGDVVVALDGDGATDPAELPRYVAALVAGADVAFGSRYTDGGRDLTAGRFRRALNLALIWLVNVLYGVHRTDPGFGYVAFWRDAIDRLGLPDPSPATPATWGDGPEIEALLAVRTAARGLRVTEVPGVAYPRMRRAARADRTALRHWLRVLAGEFRGRARPPHAEPRPKARLPRHAVAAARTDSPEPGTATPTPRRAAETGTGRRSLPGRRAAEAAPIGDAAVAGKGGPPAAREPIWGPPRRRSKQAELRLADVPELPDRAIDRVIGQARPINCQPVDTAVFPRPAEIGPGGRRRDDQPDRGGTAGSRDERPRREVGMKRRRIEPYRERPDLRLINGEGTGSNRIRSGRLRAVPRETTGGIG